MKFGNEFWVIVIVVVVVMLLGDAVAAQQRGWCYQMPIDWSEMWR